MNDEMDGDMTRIENIKQIESILKQKVTMYTADGSVDIGEDFISQEKLNFKLLVGEMLCALKSLKRGGSAVIKMFACTEMITISAVHHFVMHFEEAHIVKPATSRPQNSELYLIAKSFKGGNTQYEKELQEVIESNATIEDLSNDKLQVFYDIIEYFTNTQIHVLNEIVTSLNTNTPLDPTEKQRAEDIWLSMHQVSRIDHYLSKVSTRTLPSSNPSKNK